MTVRYALRHPNYDGKGGTHFKGCTFRYDGVPENLDEATTYRTQGPAKATNEFKYWGFEIVPLYVTISLDNPDG